MISNKKGLSTVVATLLIILLVIVAVGVLAVVFRNTISSGTGQFDLGTKCLAVNLDATSARCNTASNFINCSVTIHRSSGGDEISGVKLIFSNADETSSASVDWSGNIAELATVTNSSMNTTLENTTTVSKIEVVPYFTDESGNEQLCSSGATLDSVTNVA